VGCEKGPRERKGLRACENYSGGGCEIVVIACSKNQ
jgi:hypothetical protein